MDSHLSAPLARGLRRSIPWVAAAVALAALLAATCATTREVVATKPHRELGKFVDVRGVSTYYEHSGEGAPTVVLIHGLGASTYTYHRNLLPLADHFSVYALDLKGFGASDKPGDGYGLDEMRDHVSGFLDTTGVRRAVVVGHSMGGEIALRLTLQQPERVQALVLIDSAGFLEGSGTTGAAGRSIQRLFSEKGLVTQESVRAYGRPLRSRGGANALIARTRADDWGGVADRIGEIAVPTLVLWGEADQLLPVAHAERFQTAIPHAQVITYPDCGHRPTIERADDVNRDLIAFITGLP